MPAWVGSEQPRRRQFFELLMDWHFFFYYFLPKASPSISWLQDLGSSGGGQQGQCQGDTNVPLGTLPAGQGRRAPGTFRCQAWRLSPRNFGEVSPVGVTQGTPPASRPRGCTVTKPRRWRLSWAGDAPCQGTCPRAGSCQARKLLARAHPAQSPEKDAERDKPLIHRLLPGCFDSAQEQHPQAVPRAQQPRFPAPGLARSQPTLPWAGLAAPPCWRERSKIPA